MIRNTQLALLGILVGAGQAAAAAENATLQVSGSVRARYEYLDGQYRPGLDARDDQLAVRSTLQAQWRRGSWRLVGELFDSRAYAVGAGSAVSANDVNTFEPVQAYVQRDLAGPFAAGSSVRAGRFTLNLGSRRLVASDDYRNTPQGSTGVHADLRAADSTQYQLFYVLPQQHRPDDLGSVLDNDWKLDHEGRDLTLWGALVTRPGLLPGGTLGEVGYVGLREKDDPPRATRDRRLHTFNVRALREPAAEQVDFEVEGIVQAGSISASTAVDAARQDVNAWFLHAEAGYTRADAWKTHLSLEFDHATGDKPGGDYQRFDTLYGMRRADLAPSGIFGMVGRANLTALGLRVEVTPSDRVDFFAAWRLLQAASRTDAFSTSGIRDASGAAGRNAGHLFDARLRWWLVPRSLRAEFTTTWVLRGRMLREAPNASPWGDTQYGSAALTWSF